MARHLIFLIFLSAVAQRLGAQIWPKEGVELNYRMVGFLFPAGQHSEYLLEIAIGTYNDENAFNKNKIKTLKERKNKVIAEVPAFGTNYSWRVTYPRDRAKSEIHHFSTGTTPEADTTLSHFRILKKSEKHKEAFVFVDANKAMYDMNGKLVWYLPLPERNKQDVVRDLKITSQGTITYVIDERGAYEINYGGKLLWQAPDNGLVSGDSIEHYHHEFTRLANGNYMALGQEFQYWKQPNSGDTNLFIVPKEKIKTDEINKYMSAPMGTLIEYNKRGEVIWYWKSSTHLNGSGLFYRRSAAGGLQMRAHENSFFFDERSGSIYVSCRNLSRIIKIKYPQGGILNVYGNVTTMFGTKNENTNSDLFCGQHSCRVAKNGDLYLFDNNNCHIDATPKIVMIKQPVSPQNHLEKSWEYKCPVSLEGREFPSGGNVIELSDHSFFVSMAYPGSDVFIVNMQKQVEWRAVVEKYNALNHSWETVNLFRASIIQSRQEMERLIWNSESN